MGGRLPAAMGYGVAVSAACEMFRIGGQTASAASKAVYRLRPHGADVETDRATDANFFAMRFASNLGKAGLARPICRNQYRGLAAEWKGHAIVLGESDGALAAREAELKDEHPGFSRDVRMYDRAGKRWTSIGAMPASLVTTGCAWWGNELVIPGGEDRPGHRSARVIAVKFSKGS